jgi:hypothetical protein
MDEATQRLTGVFPEDMVFWLARQSERRGWSISRTMRWAIGETMKAELGEAEAVEATGHLPELTTLEAFHRPIDELIKGRV